MVNNALSEGATPLAVRIPGFNGKLGSKSPDQEGAQLPRLGRELASAAKLAGVAGIFHSDELPSYGISEEDVITIRTALELSESDAFAFCIAPHWQAKLALESVIERCRMAYHRIPQEVRNVVVRKGQPDDGTTTALRPLPGGARMYPETDIPIQDISIERWEAICSNLPLSSDQRLQRLFELDISHNQAESILNGELDDILFEGIEGDLALPAKAWASALLEFGTSNVPALSVAIHLKETGQITREGIIPLVEESSRRKTTDLIHWMLSEATSQGFIPANNSEVEDAVDAIMIEKADFISERGMSAVGPLMGLVMQRLGGSADGKIVSQVLRDKISSISND
tara:strand:- start:1785 stop:2810 length:1026 start_codon:yes stop_codon:yes gene_type:complete